MRVIIKINGGLALNMAGLKGIWFDSLLSTPFLPGATVMTAPSTTYAPRLSSSDYRQYIEVPASLSIHEGIIHTGDADKREVEPLQLGILGMPFEYQLDPWTAYEILLEKADDVERNIHLYFPPRK
jgi:hypothetical protein